MDKPGKQLAEKDASAMGRFFRRVSLVQSVLNIRDVPATIEVYKKKGQKSLRVILYNPS